MRKRLQTWKTLRIWGDGMEKSEIKVSCNDQVLKITESPVLAAGGVNEVRVVFTFCEKWVGFAKTAVFYRDENEVYHAVLDENDTCVVPWEVCYEAGTFYFGVFGEKDDIRRTSNVVRYKVKNGVVASGMVPSAPSQEVYDQVMAEVAKMQETTKNNIKSIEKTGTEGLVDTYTITFVGGSTQTFTVTNGAKGDTGAQGIQGEKGEKGDPGEKGEQGIQGVPGTNGIDGKDGVNGKDGTDGYTPVKGVDYFTPEEVQGIAEQAAGMVDVPEGGGVTSWNDLTDKPFGEGVLYEWNKDTEYTEMFETPWASGDSVRFVKISVDTPDADYFVGKTLKITYTDERPVATQVLDSSHFIDSPQQLFIAMTIVVLYEDGTDENGNPLTKGVWCMDGTYSIAAGTESIQILGLTTLDEKYIPDTIARTADVQTMIDNAMGVIENASY